MQFYFQPIVDVKTGVPVAAEALVRWHLPNGQVKFPGPWLDIILDDPALSVPFHDLMWASVAVFAGLLPHIRISYNTPPHRVGEEGWAAVVLGRCERLGVNPHQLTIEVVEGSLLQDTPCVRHNLETVRSAGCKVALDDFGEGNSNLVTFMGFSDLIDSVKIDQKLVRHADVRAAASLIYLARAFCKHLVAEGVETEEQLHTMRTLGVEQVQGWYFAKAMPLAEFQTYALKAGSFPPVI